MTQHVNLWQRPKVVPAGRKGAICIDLQPSGPGFLADGPRWRRGFAEGFWPASDQDSGLKLVSDLTRQLDGAVELKRNTGTVAKITFAELV